MEEYLVCIHAFSESSPESLREATAEGEIGKLIYAVKVAGPTYAEMQEILSQNWLAANDRDKPKLPGFNLHSFSSS